MDEQIAELLRQNQELIKALQNKDNSGKKVTVHFEKFNEETEQFDSFIERFESYLDVQDVSQEQRAKVFISSLSPKLYQLMRNLLAPDKPSDQNLDTLKGILKKHLSPKPLIIPSRHKFLNRKQTEGESINSYIAELRALAINCEYDSKMLNIMLRDVFVSGLRNKAILDRLFEEDDIDLDKTVNIALAMEKAAIGAREIVGKERGFHVNVLKEPRKARINYDKKLTDITRSKETNIRCWRCGKENHTHMECKHKNSACNFCKKKGHLEAVCFKAKGNKSPNKKFKQLKIESVEKDPSEILPIYNFSLRNDSKVNDESQGVNRTPIMLPIEIEGKEIKMELDTGAAVSAMSYKNFRKISQRPIQHTEIRLKSYKGDMIVPLGVVEVNVRYGNQSKEVHLYIMKENLDTIFGREWLYKFKIDWNTVKSVRVAIQDKSHEAKLSELIKNYKTVFDNENATIQNFQCKLELKPNVKPVFLKSRTVPFALKERVEKEINDLEEKGIIEKVKFSEWATPVVPVVKPDGSIRLCADYSVTLNPNLQIHHHPLPKLEEIFNSLSGGRKFSKVDFSKAYLQMRVHPDSQKLLTINTHKGLYICKRLMYGLNVAPAIWQNYIDSIFGDMEGIKVFMDDARITGPDDDTHLKRLKLFFERCKQQGLKINLKKSRFFQPEINFLGYRIDSKGLRKTNEKVEALLDIPEPKNITEVKSFLGLVTFYGRFCDKLSTLAYPLNNLTKKGVPWKWSEKCQAAFDAIKEEVCSDKVLVHYDPNLPVILATDASAVGLGAVLSHRFPDGTERPIAFASKTLNKAEQHYSQIDKEALAINWGVKKFYLFLKGRRFTLITDHKPLVQIFGSKKGLPILSATRLLHYALHLQAYQFDIEYRNTKDHGNADLLSRLPLKSEDINVIDDISMFQISQIETLTITAKNIAKATTIDKKLGPLFHDLKTGMVVKEKAVHYSLQGGCVMYGHRVCIPKCYQEQILNELHSGHIGIVKMKALARSYVHWENIDRDIERMARNCTGCEKHATNPQKAKVHFWEYPSTPWERIHVDFAGPFYEHMFFIIVDAHSKWVEVFPMKSVTTTNTIEILRECFARYGLPIMLVSDNGPQFTSLEFAEFLKNNGIRHKTSAPFKPSSNGQAERYVFTLKQSLRAMRNFPGSIRQKLATFLMQYRKAPNATTDQSPAMLFLKREIRTRLDLLYPDLKRTVEEKLRKDQISFNNRCFDIGDRVAVRSYNSPNAKWKFGTILNKDGELHYTIDVNGTLVRRHIDQMRTTGLHSSQVNGYVPKLVDKPKIQMEASENQKDCKSDVLATERSVSEESSPGNNLLPQITFDEGASVSPQTLPPSGETHSSESHTETTSTQLRRSSRKRRAPDRLNL